MGPHTQWWRVRNLMLEIFALAGELTLRRSWWSVHAPEQGLPENLAGNFFWRGVVLTVTVAPERLCDDFNTIGVRYSRWMGRRN